MPTLPPALTRPRPWLALILAAFVLLGVVYSVVTPIFEASDELWHYPVIRYMHGHTLALPEQNPDDPGPWRQEGSQPPLYYWLGAVLVAPIDHSDFEALHIPNPHAKAGIGLATDNNNIMQHDSDAEEFPWQDTALAVHLVRLMGVLLGAITIWLTYHLARLAVPDAPALHLTAALLVAFNPMFLFISASVNNDTLINLLGSAILVALLILWRRGFSWRGCWMLAVLLALASITKLSGLTLVPLAGLVLLLIHVRDRLPLRSLILAGAVIGIVWAVLAGWWYVRNLDLYDDPTGLNVMIEVAGPRENLPESWSAAYDELKGFRIAYWGLFGAVNVKAPDLLIHYGDTLMGLGLAGLIVYGIRVWRKRAGEQRASDWSARLTCWNEALPVLFLALQVIIVAGGVLNWTRRTYASQGRLLFSAIAALAVLAALGIHSLLSRPRWQRWLPLAAAPLIVFAIVIPFHTIRPAYKPSPTVAALPDNAIPLDARYDSSIDLLGYTVDDSPVRPGQTLTVTLYWRPVAHTAHDMSLYVQVFGLPDPEADTGLQQIGKLDSYPGRGLLRTTTWDLNTIYADSYDIPISADARTPVRPKLKIGWRSFETSEELSPTLSDGTPLDSVIVDGGRVSGGDQSLVEGDDSGAVFAGVLRLNHSEIYTLTPGGTLTIKLEWEALARVYEDFTILVHLIDPAASEESAAPLAQADAPPLDGRWPTSAWVPGRAFIDVHRLTLPPDLPPGDYRIAVGFYRPADFSRLPVETALDTLPGAVLLPQTIPVSEP